MVDPIGPMHPEGAIGEQLDVPSTFVNQVMVLGAQGDEVVEIGEATLLPGPDVVGLTVVDRAITAAPGAASMERTKGGPLAGRCGPVPATDIDGHTARPMHDPLEHGITTEPGQRLVGEVEPIGGLGDRAGVPPPNQRLLIDDDRDVGEVGAPLSR